MSLFDVAIVGFRLHTPEPPEHGLMRVFGIDAATARTLVTGFPVVVKRAVPLQVARDFEQALLAIGARVELRTHVSADAPLEAEQLAVLQPLTRPTNDVNPSPAEPGFDWSAALRPPVAPRRGKGGELPPDPWTAPLPQLPQAGRPLPSAPPAAPASGNNLFAADLALPWLEASAASAAAAATSTSTSAALPRLSNEPLSLANAPRLAAASGPAPSAPAPELPLDVLDELGPQALQGAPPLTVSVLLALGFTACWACRGHPWFMLFAALGAGAFAANCLLYLSLQARLAGGLRSLSERELPACQRYARSYERWAHHQNFEFVTLLRQPSGGPVLAYYRHRQEARYFVLHLFGTRADWQLISLFERDQVLITSSTRPHIPSVRGLLRQSFPSQPLEQLALRHDAAHAQLAKQLSPRDALRFDELHDQLCQRTVYALDDVLLWPLRLLSWRLTLPRKLAERSIAELPEHASFSRKP